MKIHHFSQLLCIEMVLSGHFFYAPMAVRRKRCVESGASIFLFQACRDELLHSMYGHGVIKEFMLS